MVPGLTDAHVHVEGLGTALERLDLVGAASLEEALARVAAAAKKAPAGEWLLGRGWDQNDWPGKRFPTAADLDRVLGDRPAYLVRIDGHAAWASSRGPATGRSHRRHARTPKAAGSSATRPGHPAGVLVDKAMALVSAIIPEPPREVRKRRLAAGLRACAARRPHLRPRRGRGPSAVVDLYKELLAEGALPTRVYVMLRAGRVPGQPSRACGRRSASATAASR